MYLVEKNQAKTTITNLTINYKYFNIKPFLSG